MYIDTHTHMYTDAFQEDRKEAIHRALESGVKKLLLPNIDKASITEIHQLVQDFPKVCFPMMGLHPGSVGKDWEEQLACIKEELFSKRLDYIAVGEIGMDLYWDKTYQKEQELVFRTQIAWAKELNLPIVIHAREAFEEIFEILDDLNGDDLTGIFHCFTGNLEQAQKVLNYGGFKLGIGGVLTYKKAGLDSILKEIPIEHIVLETDAPYLPPVPFRGKRNESSYLTYIGEKLADIYQMEVGDLAEQTSLNAHQIFKKLTPEE
jgi:TatD DNase family protein